MTIKLSFCISIMNRLYQLKQTLRKNLDDNIKYKNEIDFILVDFNSNDDIINCIKNNDENILIHQSSNIFGYGNMGRITLSKNNFLNLGGYDESLLPMSHQDGDLVNRAKIYGLKYININDSEYNKTIKNSKEESIKNCYGKLDYVKMMKINNLISNFNIKTKRIKANNYTSKLKIGLLENIIKIK